MQSEATNTASALMFKLPKAELTVGKARYVANCTLIVCDQIAISCAERLASILTFIKRKPILT